MWQDDNDKIMEILDNIELNSKVQFPVKCPICGKNNGHLYFHRYKNDNVKGGMWVWCSACRHSAHTMFKIPEWWQNLNDINFEELTALPECLEKNKKLIDEWINKLLFEK